jgi:uncharacterized protein with von Willebrand factor type A (vWA) domain
MQDAPSSLPSSLPPDVPACHALIAELSTAMRAIRARAKKVVWLNPLLGDERYEPTARGMAAALPYIDIFAPAHNLEALERLVPRLSAA